jgi:peptidoglycan hydrolase-like protein with peptidoglycan-binding domain
MGPKTKAAIRSFQQAENLKATGRLDSETRAKLGVGTAARPDRDTSPSASPRIDQNSPRSGSSPSSSSSDSSNKTQSPSNSTQQPAPSTGTSPAPSSPSR